MFFDSSYSDARDSFTVTTESEHVAQESMGSSCFGSAFDGVIEMPKTYARQDEVY